MRESKKSVRNVDLYCPDCKQKIFGPVCTNCGLVMEDHPIDFNPETDNLNRDPEEKPTIFSYVFSMISI